jgi:hypothetical protein
VKSYLLNQSQIWTLDGKSAESLKSSLSDESGYMGIVRAAVDNIKVFEKFRSNREYLDILDHVSYEQGLAYWQSISDEKLSFDINWIRNFNRVGSPLTYPYHQITEFQLSPTLLRYMKVAKDLEKYFGNLSDLIVGEIGIGYGGQTLVLNQMYGTSKFVWFDLPEVMQLAEKFIGEVCEMPSVQQIDGRNPTPHSVDLIVSNYAFSELSPAVQKQYLDNAILKSSRGYVTWNVLSERLLGGLSSRDFMSLVPGAKSFPEIPETYPGNQIIVWGQE